MWCQKNYSFTEIWATENMQLKRFLMKEFRGLKHLALLQLHILTVPVYITHTYHGCATTGKPAGSSLHFSTAKNDARVAEIVQMNYP